MRRLMLLRHAKTEHDAPSGQDHDRRLDERGRLDAAAIGTWVGQHQPLPDAVKVSTAVRARQTWEIACEAMQGAVRDAAPPEVEWLDEIYGAEPAQLFRDPRNEALEHARRAFGSLITRRQARATRRHDQACPCGERRLHRTLHGLRPVRRDDWAILST